MPLQKHVGIASAAVSSTQYVTPEWHDRWHTGAGLCVHGVQLRTFLISHWSFLEEIKSPRSRD